MLACKTSGLQLIPGRSAYIMEKVNRIIIFVFVLLGLSGCASLKNITIIQQNKDIRVSTRKDGSLLVNLQTSTSEWAKKGEIDSDMSFAVDKNGNKYHLQTEPFQIAHDHPKSTSFTADIVWLTSPENNDKMPWFNSVWSIHIVLRSERGIDIFKSKFDLNDG